jgi:stalled ribosome alternative rescue factor ArfA
MIENKDFIKILKNISESIQTDLVVLDYEFKPKNIDNMVKNALNVPLFRQKLENMIEDEN